MKRILLLFFISPICIFAQTNLQKFAAALETQKKARLDSIASYISIKDTDVVADIGSGNGVNIIKLSKYFPNRKYYVEDIDSLNFNRKNFIRNIKFFNPNIPIDSFQFVYGTQVSTNLPKKFFSKVLMVAVVHEMSDKEKMFSDIKSILIPNGYIIIEEPLVHKVVPKDKGCNYPYLTEEQFKHILNDNGIEILQESFTNIEGENYYRKIFKCQVQ
jgi:SAM-dependent methyltransferase